LIFIFPRVYLSIPDSLYRCITILVRALGVIWINVFSLSNFIEKSIYLDF